MKLPENLLSRLLLAYLPFMVYPLDLFRSGVAAVWIVAFFWVTAAFFWFTRRFFPERSLKPAFFLWLLVWAQSVWTVTKLPPFWIVSVFFLTPVSFLEGTGKAGRIHVFSREVPRSQYLSISAKRKLGPSKLPFWERNKKFGWYLFERVLAGLGFIVFAMLLTLVRETCEKRLGMSLAGQPAGLFFAFAALAFLWKNLTFRRQA